MEPVLDAIFSFSGGRNYLHRQVCREFRWRIKADTHTYLHYADELCKEGLWEESHVKTCFVLEMVDTAIGQGLVNLLDKLKVYVPHDVVNIAAFQGNLEILQWAKENGYSLGDFCVTEAVRGGHLRVLQWLDDNGCYTYDDLYCLAAEVGSVEILEWLDDRDDYYTDDPCAVCNCAAREGHIQVLEWCLQKGWAKDSGACYFAAKGDQLETLKWLRDKG
ncbi:Ankyrin repeat-containing protein [Cedratvirus Zaza IHUMI]|uniref:Ankyrin repeat-containing protein n=1 Tax=Cedratvirus Zaza IHUMI TaxID=2126979 RepID=A0A2R8FEX9_9VIRU|nr:Ankyrin repeat-containing protein [Cedratvirus Zaza IHUMI]